jgi:hypothetical protein
MQTKQSDSSKENKELAFCAFSDKFFDSFYKNKKSYPTISECDYTDTSPEATVKRIGRPSFRNFFGYKNHRVYDAYFSGHLFLKK